MSCTSPHDFPRSQGQPPSSQRALVVAAKPGDEMLGCGGTLERLRHAGCRVTPMDAAGLSAEYGETLVLALVAALNAQKTDLLLAPSPLEPDAVRRAWGMASVEAARRVGGELQLALYEVVQPGRANWTVDISGLDTAKGDRAEAALALSRFRALALPGASLAEAFELWPAGALTDGLPGLYASEHQRHAVRGEALDGPRDMPLVSVLVRSMQRDCLADALDSVALQTWPNLEVVVINARGGQHRELGERSGRFPLRLVNQAGAPLSRPVAANLGLDSARGQWLMFLDDDDLLDPDHVVRLRAALTHEPDALAAYAGVRLISRDGQPAGVLDEPFDSTRLWLANYLPIHAVLFARQAVDQGLRFDESLRVYEDWDFWRQLTLRQVMLHVPGVSATYRLMGNSGLSARPDEQVAAQGRAHFYRKWLPRLDPAELDALATSAERHRIGQLNQARRAAQAQADMDQARQQAAQLNIMLAQKDAAIQAMAHQHDQLAARLAQEARAHQLALTEMQQALTLQREHAGNLAAQLTATQAGLAAVQADHRHLEQGYRQVTASLSWRVTAPLRALRSAGDAGGLRKLAVRVVRSLPVSAANKQRLKVRLSTRPLGSLGPRVLRWLAAAPASPMSAAAAAPNEAREAASPLLDKEVVRAEAETALTEFLVSRQRLVLRRGDGQPRVSVVVVLYNQAGLSLMCLQALALSRGVDFETLIVDNASTDRMPQLLDRVDGARLLRQSGNLGFLRAVNLAAGHATGRYLLLLNNDAVVEPDTLAHAVARLELEPDAGAAGGPIVLWDGRLQEAGSIIWRDGSCQGYGRGDSPDAPEYNFVRDVDYCSGAFLMIRRALFEQLGRFDDAYAPAYYEESDFCVRLWEAGQRVVYDPRLRVRHFEFASEGGSGQALALQARNRNRFVAKHGRYLQTRPLDNPAQVLAARQVVRAGGRRVLIIDDRVPAPDLGRGYPRAAKLAAAISAGPDVVTYYPLLFADGQWGEVHSVLDSRTEVMLHQGIAGLPAFLAQRAGHYDLMLVSRPHNMEIVESLRALHRQWFEGLRLVYDAEALFSLREIEKARAMGAPLSHTRAQALLDQELSLARRADRVVAVSEDEARHFRQVGCDDVVVLGHALTPQPSLPSFEQRQGFLFVGAITLDDCPNGDSVLWFARQVWPWVQAELGAAAQLDVVGVCESAAVRALASDSIRIHGRVPDLAPYFDARRVFIVPTRFAAGVPHKAHEAASRGLPMVVTALIARQLGWQEEVLIADGAPAFAAACIRLHRDADLWSSQRSGLLAAVERDCSAAAFERAVREIVR